MENWVALGRTTFASVRKRRRVVQRESERYKSGEDAEEEMGKEREGGRE